MRTGGRREERGGGEHRRDVGKIRVGEGAAGRGARGSQGGKHEQEVGKRRGSWR